jgi:5-methylcytosine-specific restriction protein B
MPWIKPERVRHALKNLSDWHKSAPDQGSKHLLPLLALLEQGAGVGGTKIEFGEKPHEYDFWDRYFLLGVPDPKRPYFNQLTLRRGEAGYPHSNAATIRKKTFDLKWHAGTLDQAGGKESWSLAADYADIVRARALTKGGETFRVPVVDLAVILFRTEDIDPATAIELQRRFRARFKMDDGAYAKLFVFHDEDANEVFTAVKPPAADMMQAIESALIENVVKPSAAPSAAALTQISDLDDPILSQVQEILSVGTSGIILTGAPGTGKTFYAQRIAETLVNDPVKDVFRVQFHPSYGYEDFVEGYRPQEGKISGFAIMPKVFIDACTRAKALGDDYVVMIVDEINRGDPARIFGELLTYLERSYRGRSVILPFSGDALVIPKNLLLVGTMNPYDRSVSHIDAAFVRRFDHIQIDPSREVLEDMLEGSGLPLAQIEIIGNWFDEAQKLLPIGLGHAVFADVKNVDTLKTIWRYRIRPTAESLMESNPTRREDFSKSYDAMIRRLEGGGAGE